MLLFDNEKRNKRNPVDVVVIVFVVMVVVFLAFSFSFLRFFYTSSWMSVRMLHYLCVVVDISKIKWSGIWE